MTVRHGALVEALALLRRVPELRQDNVLADNTAVAADFTGVNSIQLYQDGEHWRILALYYHVEKPGAPIPLHGGHSGRCLP